jgi:enoyl-[acyl-carrier protein] reductase I
MWWSWTRRVLEKGLFARGATTLAFTSEGGQKHWEGYSAVGASKSVLESLMRSMAAEGGSHGIRANLIQAGITPTPSLTYIPGHEEMLEGNRRRNPLGRNTIPEDVARVVRWLAGPDANWVNGAIIPVDGGEHLK